MIKISLGMLSSPGHSQLTPMAPGSEAQAQEREVCVAGIWQQHPENQNGHEVSLHCALKPPLENVLAMRSLLGNLLTNHWTDKPLNYSKPSNQCVFAFNTLNSESHTILFLQVIEVDKDLSCFTKQTGASARLLQLQLDQKKQWHFLEVSTWKKKKSSTEEPWIT